MLTRNELEWLLHDLCVKLGYCLPALEQERLLEDPPADVDRFTTAVLLADGDHPTSQPELYGSVRELVGRAFAGAAAREIRTVVAGALHRYRALTHGDLRRLVEERDRFEATGASGGSYQVEIAAAWSARPGGALRVLAHAEGGAFGAPASFTDGFNIAPDGSFLGE